MKTKINITGEFGDVVNEDRKRRRLMFWINFFCSWFGFRVEQIDIRDEKTESKPTPKTRPKPVTNIIMNPVFHYEKHTSVSINKNIDDSIKTMQKDGVISKGFFAKNS